MFKIIIIIMILIVVGSLGSALFTLLKDSGQDSKRTVKALTIRVAVSLIVFMVLIIGYFTGLIQPHGVS